MRFGIVAAIVLAACYGDPDYGHMTFQCGDDQPCPPSQTCDTSIHKCRPPPDGVACGAAGQCATGMKCCFGAVAGPQCVSGTDMTCAGVAASCDGPNDCAIGSQCCAMDGSPICDVATCAPRVCTTKDDCPASQDCMMEGAPWGMCEQSVTFRVTSP